MYSFRNFFVSRSGAASTARGRTKFVLGAAKLYVVYNIMRPAWIISYSLALAPSSGEEGAKTCSKRNKKQKEDAKCSLFWHL